jgi:hypothetical protein
LFGIKHGIPIFSSLEIFCDGYYFGTQLTANLLVGCHLGMALGCGLTSVRGNRGKNYKNEPLVPQKHTTNKKIILEHS